MTLQLAQAMLLNTSPLEGEPPVTGGFSSQKFSNVESDAMSKHHHSQANIANAKSGDPTN